MTYINLGAEISGCKTYRYHLWRKWGSNSDVMTFIMLNPSTADAMKDDPTIRKCVNYAKREGCDAISVVNLFALRTPNPDDLYTHPAPVGPENDEWIVKICKNTSLVVAAWGNCGDYLNRAGIVSNQLNSMDIKVSCLIRNKSGSPRHPLYCNAKESIKTFTY